MSKVAHESRRFRSNTEHYLWERVQKSALRFAAGFLDRGMRTEAAKDMLFFDVLAFMREYSRSPKAAKKGRGRR